MDSKFVLSNSFNEVVFEHRHKSYGAYQIRRQYGHRMLTAAFFACLLFSSLFLYVGTSDSAAAAIVAPPINSPNKPLVISCSLELPPVEEYAKPKVEVPSTPPPAAKSSSTADPKSDVIVVTTDPAKTEIPDNTTGGDPKGIEGGDPAGDPNSNGDPDDPAIGSAGGAIEPNKMAPPIWVPEMPENDGLQAFLRANIVYPIIDRERNIQGTVYIEFVVNADGSYRDIKVVKGVSPNIDREALRVISKMPKWKPGRNNDQAVPVRLTLPIAFKLQG